MSKERLNTNCEHVKTLINKHVNSETKSGK